MKNRGETPFIRQSEIKEAVSYDEETGVFRWSSPRCKIQVGSAAGFKRSDGYIHIKINGRSYLGHILAWIYVYGVMPTGEIDHINHIRSDNRIKNLRDVSPTENAKNKKRYKNNSTGHTGVFLKKDSGKYTANINANGVLKHLGTFKTKDEAVAVRVAAEKIYGYHENHGDKL